MSILPFKKQALAGAMVLALYTANADAGMQNFRQLTWNVYGSTATTDSKWVSTIVPQFLDGNYDVVALQEAGPQAAIPTTANHINTYPFLDPGTNTQYTVEEYAWLIGTQDRGTIVVYLYFMRTDFTTNRNNLVLITQEQAYTQDGNPGIYFIPSQATVRGVDPQTGQADWTRPTFGVRVHEANGDNTVFFSMHARPFAGNEVNNVIPAIQNALPAGYDWALLGDFNQDPAVTQPVAAAQHLQIFNSGEATHQEGGEFDYVVARINNPNPIPWVGERVGMFGSDHTAVTFHLGGAAAEPARLYHNYYDNTDFTASAEHNLSTGCWFETTSGWTGPVDITASVPELGSPQFVTGLGLEPIILSLGADGFVYRSEQTANGCNFDNYTLMDATAGVPANDPMLASFAAAENTTDQFYVIGADAAGNLYSSTENVDGTFTLWNRPSSLSNAIRHNPVLLAGADNELVLVGTDDTGTPYFSRQNPDGSWATWFAGGSTPSGVVQIIGSRANGYLHIFALTSGGTLYHISQSGSNSWSSWSAGSAGGFPGGASPFEEISVATNAAGTLHLFGVDFSGYVWHLTYANAGGTWGWSAWNDPIDFARGISAAAAPDGTVELLVEDTSGDLQHAYESSNFTVSNVCSNRCLAGGYYVSTSNANTKIWVPTNKAKTDVVRLELVDELGNPMPKIPVQFKVISGSATLSTPSGVTDASGQFSSNVTGSAGSTAKVTAWFDSDFDGATDSVVQNGSPAQVTFATGG